MTGERALGSFYGHSRYALRSFSQTRHPKIMVLYASQVLPASLYLTCRSSAVLRERILTEQ